MKYKGSIVIGLLLLMVGFGFGFYLGTLYSQPKVTTKEDPAVILLRQLQGTTEQ